MKSEKNQQKGERTTEDDVTRNNDVTKHYYVTICTDRSLKFPVLLLNVILRKMKSFNKMKSTEIFYQVLTVVYPAKARNILFCFLNNKLLAFGNILKSF